METNLQKDAPDPLSLFIVSTNSMFGAGLDTVLRREPGICIVGQEDDLDRAIQAIRVLHPDLVIFVSHVRPGESTQPVTSLLKSVQAKVLSIDLQSNLVGVYTDKSATTEYVGDLVQAIRAEVVAKNSMSIGQE